MKSESLDADFINPYNTGNFRFISKKKKNYFFCKILEFHVYK